MPSELGTVTLLTFLMMLPEHPTSSVSGSHPSTKRASAAAYATAMGSVQPSAQMSSLFSRSHRASSRWRSSIWLDIVLYGVVCHDDLLACKQFGHYCTSFIQNA